MAVSSFPQPAEGPGPAADVSQTSDVPQIDFAPFIHGSAQGKQQVASAIDTALAQDGFIYLRNHGIDQAKIDQCFSLSKRFFALPEAEKKTVAHNPSQSQYRGYSSVGQEKIRGRACTKESFNWRGSTESNPSNQWPPETMLPGFQLPMEEFYQDCNRLINQLLECLSLSLGLPSDDSLGRYHTKSFFNCDLIHYPAVSTHLLRSGDAVRCPAHADLGTLTLLFQDNIGGLEIVEPGSTSTETTAQAEEEGKFKKIQPKPGTVLVNAGHILMRWSNGRWKNTIHRVSEPPIQNSAHDQSKTTTTGHEGGAKVVPERYSIAFFSFPDPSTIVEALPGCWSEENPKRWKPLDAADFLSRKLKLTFG